MREFREIDRHGWIVIAAVGFGNAILTVSGFLGHALYSVVLLAVLGFSYVVLLQLTRSLLQDTLELAQDSTEEWQNEADFAHELVDGYLKTIEDLKRHDVQRSGIHLERLRTTLVKRYPELEEITMVHHPLDMPGFVI